jgi:RHS repeat-associated protein
LKGLLGYAGQYTDPTTGLEYNQARWYDPATGQFMVIDPKVESTWQAYAYADDNPISLMDPTGLCGSTSSWGAFWSNCGSDAVNAVKKAGKKFVNKLKNEAETLVGGKQVVAAVGSFASKHPEAAAVGVALYCLVSDGVPCAIASAGAGTFSAGIGLATGHFSPGTNGLLRQYFPKGKTLAGITQAELDEVARKLNDRPRQTLGFRTPAQKLSELIDSAPQADPSER